MDNWSAWQTFFTTGSVLDYIRYKSIQDAKDTGAITVNREETDEKREKNPTGRETSRKTDRNAVPCSAAGSFTFDELPLVRRQGQDR